MVPCWQIYKLTLLLPINDRNSHKLSVQPARHQREDEQSQLLCLKPPASVYKQYVLIECGMQHANTAQTAVCQKYPDTNIFPYTSDLSTSHTVFQNPTHLNVHTNQSGQQQDLSLQLSYANSILNLLLRITLGEKFTLWISNSDSFMKIENVVQHFCD